MIKVLIATAASLVIVSAAVAADIPRAQPAPVQAAPVGKMPIGKGPIGKGPVGKAPIGKAPAPLVTRG